MKTVLLIGVPCDERCIQVRDRAGTRLLDAARAKQRHLEEMIRRNEGDE